MLDGKICLVTGSGAGIGRATAIEMARQNAAAVMVADVDDEAGEETVKLVADEGAAAAYRHCDV
ncbi:MAG TPA: SDR family NAD(P)-dependent oxidoreductase, partial [Isosphaeraceae bacterium]|nr:SDR family NAD(P)-dependent oxidoreductase [Isosphaeraceae bacterium]